MSAAAERVRVNRFLAGRGLSSRRGADRLVEEGRVLVNQRRAGLGDLVDPLHDLVTVDGTPIPGALALRTLMLNKPAGVVSTRHDPQGRATVLELLEEPAGLVPVGRLDADSRGLLLLTNDGTLAMRLTHPRHGVTKTYWVTLTGIAGERLLRGLCRGVELDDGVARAVSARLVGRERAGAGDVVEVVMREGRRREVRRMIGALGSGVGDLRRIAVGPIQLGRLLEGQSRALRSVELDALYAAAGLERPARGASR